MKCVHWPVTDIISGNDASIGRLKGLEWCKDNLTVGTFHMNCNCPREPDYQLSISFQNDDDYTLFVLTNL